MNDLLHIFFYLGVHVSVGALYYKLARAAALHLIATSVTIDTHVRSGAVAVK